MIFGFFNPPSPLVHKFTQPPLLKLVTMSAFEGTPLPPQCGRHKWKPPIRPDRPGRHHCEVLDVV